MLNSHRLLPRPLSPGAIRCYGVSVALALGLGLGSSSLAQQPLPSATASGFANPTISGGRIVRPTLRLGSQGESVRELQSMLILLGYYAGSVSGIYLEDTQLAVQRFQQAAAITADGIVGPTTWSKLLPAPVAETTPPGQTTTAPTITPSATTPPATNPTPRPTPRPTPPANRPSTPPTPPANTAVSLPVLRPGMEGDAVRFLQQRLRAKQLYTGPIDGIFGSQTEAAVRQLQRDNDLLVDGIVGPATWSALD